MKHVFLGMDNLGFVSYAGGQIFRAWFSNQFMAKGHIGYCGLICRSLMEK